MSYGQKLNLLGGGKFKTSSEILNWTLGGVSKDKMTLKKILEYSKVIVGNF